MRVLHFVKTSLGASWALRQMQELITRGVDVHVAIPPGGPLIPQYEAAGIIVHQVNLDCPVRQPWLWLHVMHTLRRLVATVRPDILHSHFVGTTLIMRLALGRTCRIPRVFQVPGPLHLEHRLFRSAELATASSADVWIGSCRWTCDRYRAAGIPPERIFLSYYGTDLQHFVSHDTGYLRRELNATPETKLIGMVAYMYAPKRYLGQSRGLKGHEDLIDAIAIALKTVPTLRGVIIGGAWNGATAYAQQVRTYAQQRCKDRIVFLGTRHDVPRLYPDLDVVVHPSLSENVGGAVESLLMGRPTIATNVGGFPDLVKNGETGWLVPPRAPEQLAQTIVYALQQPDKGAALAHQGQALARHLFNVKRTAQEIAEIYFQLLDRPGAAA